MSDATEPTAAPAIDLDFDWEYVPGNEHHGPYITSLTGNICDFYVMSNPSAYSFLNGGNSRPICFQGADAEANARLAAASKKMLRALEAVDASWTDAFPEGPEGPREWAGGLGQLSDETVAMWLSIRAAIAAARGTA